jgi:hypothetical protein
VSQSVKQQQEEEQQQQQDISPWWHLSWRCPLRYWIAWPVRKKEEKKEEEKITEKIILKKN